MAEEAKAKDAEKEAPKGREAEAKEGETPEGGDAAAPKGLFADKKKLVMFGGIGVGLLLIVAGLAVWFLVLRHPKDADGVVGGAGAANGAVAGPSVYFDVPEFSLNLAPSGQQEHFLRLKVTLELATAEEQKAVETNAARLQDDYLQYLRQLRLDDLRGNAGLQRMKEDLLLRASQTLAPVRVKNVLFREVLVQ